MAWHGKNKSIKALEFIELHSRRTGQLEKLIKRYFKVNSSSNRVCSPISPPSLCTSEGYTRNKEL